jgi:hypothetical protein
MARNSSSRYKISNRPNGGFNGPLRSTGLIDKIPAGRPWLRIVSTKLLTSRSLFVVSLTFPPAMSSSPATFKSTKVGLAGVADPDVTTFCKIRESSDPENGKSLAQFGGAEWVTAGVQSGNIRSVRVDQVPFSRNTEVVIAVISRHHR